MKKIQKNLQPLLSQRTLCTKKIQKPSLLHIASSLPLPLLKSISLLLSTALRLLSRPLYEAKQRLPSLPLYETACATPSAPWPNPSAQPHLRPGAPRSLSLPGLQFTKKGRNGRTILCWVAMICAQSYYQCLNWSLWEDLLG
ncbi:hypothetical protein MRB53_010101 [Persea americana]|uniref:Uncharacterized protein n=1 Tax=Persea americana TaxID=3435 RepID=A0ACC2LS09_PERAE|nr:hypothetical protein MRB53_010101 [Persea americana]